jgi:putative adhesin
VRGKADLGDLLDEIGGEVRGAVNSLQTSEIGRVVGQEVNKAVGSLQRVDVGGIVGEIVDQVREAVGDVVERSGRQATEEEEEWTFDGASVNLIHAEAASGNIELTGTDADQIHVHALKRVHGRDEEAVREFAQEMKLRAVADSGTLRLYQEPPQPPKGVRAEVRYSIQCPASVAAELRLVNGNVACEGIHGNADAQTTNGNAKLRRCSGRIRACTRNGNARAQLDELREECVLETTNGNVSVEVSSGQGQLTATSRNGNVHVSLPPEFCGKVDAQTTNGTVVSDVPLTHVSEQKRNLLIGQLGEDGGAELRLHTLNGNVRLRQLQAEE